jgi:hypothetical protein
MKVESINQTIGLELLQDVITGIRADGAYLVLTYRDREVYFNDQGREVFRVTLDPPPPPPKPLSRWTRFWHWLTYIQLSPNEQEEIQQWARHRK